MSAQEQAAAILAKRGPEFAEELACALIALLIDANVAAEEAKA